jgi:DNA polymerase II large subunit
MFCHPLFHAAMRRNCDGDEACVILLLDALINFSRSYLPDKRGSRTMDAPLVLTSLLVPGEVDDEVHGMDIVWSYPLELYEAAQNYKYPWEVEIKQIDNVLNTPAQYEGMGYTHKTENMNSGVLCSAYKLLPTMKEKLHGQMILAEKITAVEPADVAQLVIEKHFLKDIKGNLSKFSTQQFRCVGCNTKFRRPPLAGKCTSCKGKIIFTISEGSIVKYLEPTLSLARKYKVSTYLMQTLDFLQEQVASVLGKEKERQEGLGKWFG